MKRILLTSGIGTLFTWLLFASPGSLAQEIEIAPAPAHGWHIEICTNRSNPARILFQYKFPDAHNFAGSMQWDRGAPSDVNLPLNFRHAWSVSLWAYSDHQQTDFCLRYGERGVKHWSFNGAPESHDQDQEGSDNDCHC